MISINAHEEVLMKDDLLFWLEQIAATVLFFGAMALVYVVMVLVFHDPLLWQ